MPTAPYHDGHGSHRSHEYVPHNEHGYAENRYLETEYQSRLRQLSISYERLCRNFEAFEADLYWQAEMDYHARQAKYERRARRKARKEGVIPRYDHWFCWMEEQRRLDKRDHPAWYFEGGGAYHKALNKKLMGIYAMDYLGDPHVECWITTAPSQWDYVPRSTPGSATTTQAEEAESEVRPSTPPQLLLGWTGGEEAVPDTSRQLTIAWKDAKEAEVEEETVMSPKHGLRKWYLRERKRTLRRKNLRRLMASARRQQEDSDRGMEEMDFEMEE